MGYSKKKKNVQSVPGFVRLWPCIFGLVNGLPDGITLSVPRFFSSWLCYERGRVGVW